MNASVMFVFSGNFKFENELLTENNGILIGTC